MQGLEAQANKKVCGNCVNFLNDGDRCSRINVICYNGSAPCMYFERVKPKCKTCSHFKPEVGKCSVQIGNCSENMESCDYYQEKR